MRYWIKGTQARIPIPIPEEIIPWQSLPLLEPLLHQDDIGTHPDIPNPKAVTTLKKM